MTFKDRILAIVKEAKARDDAHNAAHPDEYAAGKAAGKADLAAYKADPDGYEDTEPPAELEGDALNAWFNGWSDGYGPAE